MSLLELPSLEERRVRGDLIEAFKLLKGIAKLDYSLFFKSSLDSKVRGHTYKIVKNSFHLDVRKNFLVIEWWMHGMSCLSTRYVVDAETVISFKARLEKLYHKFTDIYFSTQKLLAYQLIERV